MKLFSGSSNTPLARKIAEKLNLPLSILDCHIFPDGERRIRAVENVLDEDTVIIQSTATPVDDNYFELFLGVDAIKRSGAKSINLVIPYMGYQRQDHVFRSGEAVSLKVIAKFLKVLSADRIINFDPHTIKTPEFFEGIEFKVLSGLPLFAEKIRELSPNLSDIVLISPDMGGIARIKKLSELLGGIPYLAIEKERDLESGEVKVNKLVEILHPDLIGVQDDIIGKTAIIVDDIISSGGTMVKGAEFLKERGVETVFVFATHAVFSGHAVKHLQEAKDIERVFATDTIDLPESKRFEKLEVISTAGLIANQLKVQS